MQNLEEEKYTSALCYTLGSVYYQNYTTIKWRYFRLVREQWQLLGSICSCQRCFFVQYRTSARNTATNGLLQGSLLPSHGICKVLKVLPSNTASFYWVMPSLWKYSCKKETDAWEEGDHSQAKWIIASILPLPSEVKIEIRLENHELFKIVLHILVASGRTEGTDQKPTAMSTIFTYINGLILSF